MSSENSVLSRFVMFRNALKTLVISHSPLGIVLGHCSAFCRIVELLLNFVQRLCSGNVIKSRAIFAPPFFRASDMSGYFMHLLTAASIIALTSDSISLGLIDLVFIALAVSVVQTEAAFLLGFTYILFRVQEI